MGTSLTLFRVGGTDVKVHWSFLLILAYGAISAPPGVNPLFGALWGVLLILLLFVCVTLHEFGHAVAAKYFGIEVPTITLLPIGGLARLERMPEKPYQELIIAVAGPAVNFIIAALLLPIILLSSDMAAGSDGTAVNVGNMLRDARSPGMLNLIVNLVFTNLLLGIFNMLPAFPMDGGRILRALLAMFIPFLRATQIAVFVGRIMAALLALGGILGQGGILLLLIAFFIYVGGGAEREAVESRAALRGIPARRALNVQTTRLYTSERLSRAVDLITNSYQADYPIFDLSGQFVGVLTRSGLVRGLREEGPELRVVDVMISAEGVPSCAPETDLADVWDIMGEAGCRVVSVQDNSTFLGLITADDIAELIQVMGARRKGTGWQQRAAGVPDPPQPKEHTDA